MRTCILVVAMVLLSATAQAAGTRGLILASGGDPAAAMPAPAPTATAEPAPVTQVPPVTAPKFAERPSFDCVPASPKAAEKPRRKPESSEARVIRTLHRYGIYW